MKILCLSVIFWPEEHVYSYNIRSILGKLHEDGHEITVFTKQPGYNDLKYPKRPHREILDGISIIRTSLLPEKKRMTWLRCINYMIYFVKTLLFACTQNKYDLIFIPSTPPVFMGALARLISWIKKIPYIYHCEDIHPECELMSKTLKNGLVYKFLKKIDLDNSLKARAVITLSTDMADALVQRGLSREKIFILNNFISAISDNISKDLPAQFIQKAENAFKIIFAGNLGIFQELDNIIEAAKILKQNPHFKFYFIGEGIKKNDLIKKASELLGNMVFFIPFQSPEVILSILKKADLAIISLKPNIYRYAYPSKAITYFAAGCPALALIEKESELAQCILNNSLGYVCSQNNPQEIANTITKAWVERELWDNNRRQKICDFAQELFGKNKILDEWSKIVRYFACNK